MIRTNRDEPAFICAPFIIAGQGHRIVQNAFRIGEANAVLQQVRPGLRGVPNHSHICTICILAVGVKFCPPNVEVSGLRGFSRRSARLPGWAAFLGAGRDLP